MNKQASNNFSFLSKLDQNEIDELMKEIPSSFELMAPNNSSTDQVGSGVSGEKVNVDGSHILLPHQGSLIQLDNNNMNLSHGYSVLNTANMLSAEGNGYTGLNIMPMAPKFNNSLPEIDTDPGFCGFSVNIQSESNSKKTISWTYSKSLKKLYCNPNTPCPVEFHFASMHALLNSNNTTFIRATPVFTKYEHRHAIITRCENHKKSKEFDQDSQPHEISHLIRCQNPNAIYEINPINGRESVKLLFERPKNGSNFLKAIYKFMCYSSCFGGSQKPVKIVFTVESNGDVLARDSYEIKICACPGRDKITDERKLTKKLSFNALKVQPNEAVAAAAVSAASSLLLKSSSSEAESSLVSAKNAVKKQKASHGHQQQQPDKHNVVFGNLAKKTSSFDDAEDNAVFTLKVKGRKNYEILSKLNEALQLQSIISRLKHTSNNNQPSINSIPSLPNLDSLGPTTSRLLALTADSSNSDTTVPVSSSDDQNITSLVGESPNKSSATTTSSTITTKTKTNMAITALENFLERNDMLAYLNVLMKRGISNFDMLVSMDRKQLNNLKISKSDTDKLWNAIEQYRASTFSSPGGSSSVKRITVHQQTIQKYSIQTRGSMKRKRLDELEGTPTNSFVNNFGLAENNGGCANNQQQQEPSFSTSFLNSSLFQNNDSLVKISEYHLKCNLYKNDD